ncbi:MAG: FAD:protein FMN transferase [Bacteroidota bacterium]|nr:FAD:protein FMN transferase [Bacteroidota bacterium]
MRNIFYLFLLIFLSCASTDNKVLVSNSGEVQGTFYHIKYLSENAEDFHFKIDSLFAEIDSSVSIYMPVSIISRLNNGENINTDAIFNKVYTQAMQVNQISNGYFDCTVFPLVKYWGFYQDHYQKVDAIDSSVVLKIMQNVGMHNTRLTDSSIVLPKGVQLDFNAIAQGYTVDLISTLLEQNGVENYLVEVGGEIKAKGINADAKVWRVGVDKPVEEIDVNQRFQFILDLENKAMASSGDYRKFYVKDGVKYAHTINPKSGFPAQNRLLSVTVKTEKCALADAYATAFLAMGVKQTKQLYNKLADELDIYLVYTDKNGEWKTFISPGMQKRIVN